MQPSNIFVFGVPRSGTTWLGNIFDSHPDTLLRHEPDTVHPTKEFPFVLSSKDVAQYLEEARNYLLQRACDRELRIVAGTPYFSKNYRNPVTDSLRQTLLRTSRGLDAISRGNIERKIRVPDMVAKGKHCTNVLKSVDSTARLPLFARACPEHSFVYIVRHPCGVVNSRLRGSKIGKLGAGKAFKDWLKFDYAVEAGLTEADLESWSNLEIAAWGWTLINDSVLRSSRKLTNIRVVDYDELCNDPMKHSKDIFDWAGLTWSDQTERYIHTCVSTDPNVSAGYYSTQQNPTIAAAKWKTELTTEEIKTVMDICVESKACQQFLEAGR